MSIWLDITVPLEPNMPHWPGSVGFKRTTQERQEGGGRVIDSVIELDVHCGTHVDAAAHYREHGATVDSLPIDAMIGPAIVVEFHDEVITADVLRAAMSQRPERLLAKTANGAYWPHGPSFNEAFVGLDDSAARWCVDNGVRLVGIDYLSIQSRRASAETHRALMDGGVTILEGLDLRGVAPGEYELLALPMLISGAEGAPVRALLRRSS